MKLLSMDGPFQKYGTIIFDLLLLNIIWALSIIITVGIGTGAATATLFYTVDKTIIKDRGHVLSCFLKSFKENFKKATLIGAIITVAYVIVFLNLFVFDLKQLPFSIVLISVNYMILIQLIFISIYIFLLIGRLEIKQTKDYFITSFKLANRHLISTLLCMGILAGALVTLYYFPMLVIIIVSVTALLISKVITRFVLKKYFFNEELIA